MGEDLKTLLSDVLKTIQEGGKVEEGTMKELNMAYSRATNAGDCPCGSGEVFFRCCRNDWQTVAGSVRKAQKQERVEHKQQRKDTQWVCRVGMLNGSPIVEPIGQAAPPMQVAHLLLMAYNMLNNEAVMETVRMLAQSQPNQRMGTPQRII